MNILQKKKGGLINDLITGTGGLVISVILIFVVISTIIGANLLTADSVYDNATDRMAGNLTEGVDRVSEKIPTVLLIAAVVLLFGVLAILVVQARKAGMMGGGSGTL